MVVLVENNVGNPERWIMVVEKEEALFERNFCKGWGLIPFEDFVMGYKKRV
jgi:hypothetical protein